MPIVTLTAASITHLGMTTDAATREITHYLAEVAQFAPCLIDGNLPAGKIAYAEAIIVGAIERRHDMRAAVVTQSAGRQNVTTRPAAAPKYDTARFADSEIAKLAALCTAAPATSAAPGPLGSFPPASDYSSLFARPRRPL